MTHRPTPPARWFLSPAIALLLMAGLAVDRILYHLPAGDPEPYHAAVLEAVKAVPMVIGDWVGHDEELPRSAIALLKPNAILGRRFENVRTGRSVQLLIVHCQDARDIAGHYPPRCYPSSGWKPISSKPRDWTVGDRVIPGTEYEFGWQTLDMARRIIVYNFLLRPDGIIDRDNKGIRRASADRRKKHFGGGQVQHVFDGSFSGRERDEVFGDIVPSILPAVDAIVRKIEL